MGWKATKFDYVDDYRIVKLGGLTFKVFDRDRQVGEEFSYSGEAAAYASFLPKLDTGNRRDKT